VPHEPTAKLAGTMQRAAEMHSRCNRRSSRWEGILMLEARDNDDTSCARTLTLNFKAAALARGGQERQKDDERKKGKMFN
jgi:hypothetical protein